MSVATPSRISSFPLSCQAPSASARPQIRIRSPKQDGVMTDETAESESSQAGSTRLISVLINGSIFFMPSSPQSGISHISIPVRSRNRFAASASPFDSRMILVRLSLSKSQICVRRSKDGLFTAPNLSSNLLQISFMQLPSIAASANGHIRSRAKGKTSCRSKPLLLRLVPQTGHILSERSGAHFTLPSVINSTLLQCGHR